MYCSAVGERISTRDDVVSVLTEPDIRYCKIGRNRIRFEPPESKTLREAAKKIIFLSGQANKKRKKFETSFDQKKSSDGH